MLKKFSFTKKKSASFKENSLKSSQDVCKNEKYVSLNSPVGRSVSLRDTPPQVPSETYRNLNFNIGSQQDSKISISKPIQYSVRTVNIEKFLAHSQDIIVKVGSAECLDNNSIPLTPENWLSDYSPMSTGSSSLSDLSSWSASSTNIPSLFTPQLPTAAVTQYSTYTDAFESFDILNEARRTLRSLIEDISKSLDTIPKSNALPSVIEKYTRSKTSSPLFQEHQNSNTGSLQDSNKGINSLPSPHEEYLEILAALQLRCLEYREMTSDYAESILAASLNFTESNIPQMVSYSDSVNNLRDNFSNFKAMRERQMRNVETKNSSSSNIFSVFMQTTFLYTLEQQNDGYLTRLQSGVDLIKAHCTFVRFQSKAARTVIGMVRDIECISKTVGCRV